MSDTIWKFPLRDVVNEVSLPKGAHILHVAEQHRQITMWARVDPAASTEVRTLAVVGTGTPVPDGHVMFVGSVLAAEGAFVFHVFEMFPQIGDAA